jgi:hypothetical protein
MIPIDSSLNSMKLSNIVDSSDCGVAGWATVVSDGHDRAVVRGDAARGSRALRGGLARAGATGEPAAGQFASGNGAKKGTP